MKNHTWFLALIFVSCIGCFALAQKNDLTKPGTIPKKLESLFKFTGDNESVIAVYKDGLAWWSIRSNHLSLNIGINESFSIFLGENGEIAKTILEKGKGPTRVYYMDDNADGIADRRKRGTNKGEIFMDGTYYTESVTNRQKYIIKDGKLTPVKFVQRWVIAK